ncbi:hypothetical protein DCOP10_114268 [Armatimonadetes bacterium DC]|nr:hypothetical protein DCOP10_114268 [Armatimonadetes bacterium DC]
MMTVREILYWDDAAFEALKRRAKRNFRTVRAEVAAILMRELQEEAEQIRREWQSKESREGGESQP